MTPAPPVLMFRQQPVALVLMSAYIAMAMTLAASGVVSDVAVVVRIGAALVFAAGVGCIVAVWRQHVTVNAIGIATQRIVWRESTAWSDVDAVVVTYSFSRFGSGWTYSLRLCDGRRAPRETFGDIRLRERERDRLIAWIERYVPDVAVTIDPTWLPRPQPRRPTRPAWQPDPSETIRSVRDATVGPHRIVVTGTDVGYVAIVRLDGTEIERGPIRTTYREALDDGSRFVERYRNEV